MSGAARLFVGARVSVGTGNALAGAAETLARRARDAGLDIRWVPPASYHLTLRYLGWTRREAIGAIRDALAEAAAGAPRLAFRTTRLGAYASLDRATVLWAGVEEPSAPGGRGPLSQLAAQIEAACVRLGYPPEARPFSPHVTLGRLREARAVREAVLPLAEQMFGDTRLDSIALFESETKSSGSVYRELEKIMLGRPPDGAISGSERQTSPVELGASDSPRELETDPETDDGWPRGQGAHLEHDARSDPRD